MIAYKLDATGVTPVIVATGNQVLTASAAATKVGAVLVVASGHLIGHHSRRKATS